MPKKKDYKFVSIKLSEKTQAILDKPKKIPFKDLVEGYLFTIHDTGVVEGYPDKAFWCAFCGGKGKKYITLKRSDGLFVKVGATCLHRVGLDKPSDFGKPKKTMKKIKKEKEEEVKPVEVEPEPDELDKEIQDLLNTL